MTDRQVAVLEALGRGDTTTYLATLARGPLLLPVDGSGRPLAVALDDGRRAVEVFTSFESLQTRLGHAIKTCPVMICDLADHWPDPAWLLVVDPGQPTAAHLSGGDLREVLDELYDPENDVEAALLAAARAGDRPTMAVALVGAQLHVPIRPGAGESRDLTDPGFGWWTESLWSTAPGMGEVAVTVFTSARRRQDRLGLSSDTDFVVVDLHPLVSAWPDPAWALAVNPGTPMALTLSGAEVRAMAALLDEVAAEPWRFLEPEPPWWAGAPAADEIDLQVAVPSAALTHYLDGGYDRVAGLVHLRPSQRHRVDLVSLYLHLGLVRPRSPFALTDDTVHIVRWRPGEAQAQEWRVDPTPRLASATLPAGASLLRLARDGTERVLARFDGSRWVTVSA